MLTIWSSLKLKLHLVMTNNNYTIFFKVSGGKDKMAGLFVSGAEVCFYSYIQRSLAVSRAEEFQPTLELFILKNIFSA